MLGTCSWRMGLEFCICFDCRVNFSANSCNFSSALVILNLNIWFLGVWLLVSIEVQCIQYWSWLEFLWFSLYLLCWRGVNCANILVCMFLQFGIKLYLWDTSNTILTLLSKLFLDIMEVESIQYWSRFVCFWFGHYFFCWSSVNGGSILVFMLLQFCVKRDSC